jgi:hypothetical protein
MRSIKLFIVATVVACAASFGVLACDNAAATTAAAAP